MIGRLARVAALLATAWLLVATSTDRLTSCPDGPSVVAFRVEGTCGPTGIIVVDTTRGPASVQNTEVLGLGEADGRSFVPSGGCGRDPREGGWAITGPCADAGTDGGCQTRQCSAIREPDGQLWVACGPGATVLCRSRLTEVR